MSLRLFTEDVSGTDPAPAPTKESCAMLQASPFQWVAVASPGAAPKFVPVSELFAAKPTSEPAGDLRSWFNAKLLPKLSQQIELGERSARTLTEYDIALTHWEQKASLVDQKTVRNPPVDTICEQMVSTFRCRLLSEPKRNRRNQTVNKVMRHLRSIIRTLFPADTKNPNGAGVIPLFAWPTELKRQGKFVFTFSRKQLSKLYLACDHCKSKSKFAHAKSPMHSADKWRTAMVLDLNSGPRTWDLFQLPWSAIQWGTFKYGAVWFQSRKTAKVQLVPLNRVSRIHLEHLRQLFPNDKLIFQGFKKNQSFYRCWRRITAAAGQTGVAFETLRKTCNTAHNDIRDGVGAFLLGHSLHGVNATSYDNPTGRVLKAVYALKNPVEFRRGAQRIQGQSPQSS